MSGVKILILCEDKQTDTFVRRFLKHRNFRNHDFRTFPLPGGKQSGEQFVRERYPKELKAIRSKQNSYLVVVTDADGGLTEGRRRQLDEACDKNGIPRRSESDPVLMFIPRWSIETWFAYLDGNDVKENERYPKLGRERDCERHARQLHIMCHEEQKLREPAPPSLLEACEEYLKLRR